MTHLLRAMPLRSYYLASSAFLFIQFSCLISAYRACHQLDRDSLLSISLSFYPSPFSPLNWSSIDCCEWEGIACDRNGWVTRLWLPSRGLEGGISPSLTNLTRLSHLNLSHNSLTGFLPDGFFLSLNLLKILDLSFNSLLGELPTSFSPNNSLVSIQIMDLSSNRFHGTIQSSFFRQAWNLLNFNVSNNSFIGYLPSSVCINSSLVRFLDFSFNDFIGRIPQELGDCSKLEVFHAGFNSLSGQLPKDICNASMLQEISLPSNRLSGTITDSIIHLSNLGVLELNFNEVSGKIPRDIGKLSKLEKLILHMNNLGGTIPTSLMNCTNLGHLSLRDNLLDGDISTFNFSKLLQLRILDLGINNFTGQLPVTLYSCKSLTAIRLAENQLEGQISTDILALQSLAFLSLSYNRLTNISGAIKILMGCRNLSILLLRKTFVDEVMPNDDSMADLDGFQNLRVLILSLNQLTGQVPTWLEKLKNLELLDLAVNQFRGSIPTWLGSLPSLFYIDLSNNLISGGFPEELCELSTLTSEKVAAKVDQAHLEVPLILAPVANSLNYARGLQYNRLSNLPRVINLRNNSLTGNIPIKIGQLKFLNRLDLSHNNFSGNIPDDISNLCNLENLDLSVNHLSGKIPQSLGSLNFLSSFNVSYNNLQGPIPLGPQLQSFGASAYEGNLELCGPPLPNQCLIAGGNEDKDIQEEEDGREIPWFYVSMGFGFITGFWVVCGTLLLKSSWRYAYFKFLTDIKDRLCVTIAVDLIKMRRRLPS